MSLLRVLAMAMIIFMIRQTFYPHDRVLESQAWKKVVYAGGKDLRRDKDPGASSERVGCGFSFDQINARPCVLWSSGVVMVFCSSFPPACVYYLLWSISYILFPTSLWSSKV